MWRIRPLIYAVRVPFHIAHAAYRLGSKFPPGSDIPGGTIPPYQAPAAHHGPPLWIVLAGVVVTGCVMLARRANRAAR